MIDDNGILAQVPGEYIGEALSRLPQAQPDSGNVELVIDAGHLGTVRLYVEPLQARRGKHSHWFWSAYRAETVG